MQQRLTNLYRELRVYGSGVLPSSHPSPQKFLIFSQRRSGTALLVNLLNVHPDIRCEHEILADRVLLPKFFVTARAHRCQKRAYGFKLISQQLIHAQKLRHPDQFIHQLHDRGFQVIYLRRRDVVRQALSELYAGFRNVYHVRRHHESVAAPKMRVDLTRLAERVRNAEILHLFEERSLRGLPYLSVYYETALLNSDCHQATVDTIADFLDVSQQAITTDMVKVTPTELHDFIENADEVRRFIGERGYEVDGGEVDPPDQARSVAVRVDADLADE